MNANEIERDLKAAVGGACFITKTELKKAMNFKDINSVSKYLIGLQRTSGRYFIKEVARNISNNATESM